MVKILDCNGKIPVINLFTGYCIPADKRQLMLIGNPLCEVEFKKAPVAIIILNGITILKP